MTNIPKSPNDMSPQEKRELLEKLLKEKAARAAGPAPAAEPASSERVPGGAPLAIQRVDRTQKYFPLSSAQQRLWLLDQLDLGNPVYNISILLRLKGSLDVTALEQSLAAIQKRHEILSVNFTTQEGKPVQFLTEDRVLGILITDLRSEPEVERIQRAEALAGEDAQHAFDLSKDALARANLFRLDDNDHLFQFIVHHIVFDGWSLNLFLQELTALYTAICKGEQAALPTLPVQYIDFASWEEEQFEQESYQEQIDYWKQKLAGPLPVLELPVDHPRPEVQSFRAGKVELTTSPALTATLNDLSRQEGVTLFMTALSAFYVLLARYTGQEDLIVGTPIARRSRAEVEKLIGVFLNNLTLRTDLSGDINFRGLLKRVRRTALDAFANQAVPFERLLNALRIERDSSHSPVFQVFFNLLDVRKGLKLELGDLEVETPLLPEIGSIFDLTLYVQNWGDTLKLKLVYNTDLFQAERMTEFLHRYQHLLEEVTADPDRHIFALPLPNHARDKQEAIIASFDRLPNDYTPFDGDTALESLPARFERQVARFAQQPAVKTPQYAWTYETLNRMANRAARGILAQCDPAQQRVALLFDHDAPMIAGLLGALKAAKTYIPLDPSYPQQRLRYMLEDSQAGVIVTHDALVEQARVLAGPDLPVINIDTLGSEGQDENPCLEIAPDTLAYILYTSGSTGQPKGVMQIHRNVLHFIKAYTRNLHIGAKDRLTLLSSYSFDAAIMDIFGALLNGAALYPIDLRKEGALDLPQYLRDHQITIYHSTPTVYRFLLNALTPEDAFPSVRLIVLGGEAVIKRDVDLYKKYFSDDCVFINGLGPTESTVSLQYFIDKHTDIRGNSVPVGFPVEDTEVLLLNDAGEPAPLFGEIAIHSPYVALGYWQKPDVTQAAFITDAQPDGKRTYRTGDMGFMLPDGTLEFRGRKDFQVKIRGHRVEVGEVETRLMEHPAIKACAVTANDDGTGEKRLVAYFVHDGTLPSASEIRQFLKLRLPDYMIPLAFVPLESLPLTPTRKVDRRALPDPESAVFNAEHAQVAARDETESKLVQIWQELLRVPSVGVQDNFFELGGHSLMAVLLFNKIHEEFGVNLPLATLFQDATIEHLAHVIHDRTAPEIWSSLIEIEGAGDRPPFFCVHGITGDILWFRDLARCLAPDYPFYGLQSQGLDGVQAPFSTIAEMAAHYIDEIRRLQPHGPYLLGGASFGGTVALEISQQLRRQGEEVALLAIFDHSPVNVNKELQNGNFAQRMAALSRVAKNFPFWLRDFLGMGPHRMWLRLHRKLRLAKKVRGKLDASNLDQFDASDLIDFAAELPYHRQKLILSNFNAMKMYDPKPYLGQVTLFRAMSRPLMNTNDPAAGWQHLTPGRVKVVDIPSSHEGMFKKPHVKTLALRLKDCIDHVTAPVSSSQQG